MINTGTNTININALNGKISNLSTGSIDCQGTLNVNNGLINIKKSNSIGILNENPIYTVDVVGDINYTGKLLNNGNIVQTETYSVSNLWSKSGSYVYYDGKVIIGTSVQSNYNLYVAGDSYFINNIKCDGSITVLNLTSTGTITANNCNIQNLIVSKTATFNCDISMENNNLTLQNINGKDITLTGNLYADYGLIRCKNLSVENLENFSTTVTFGENIIVIGKTFLKDDFIINTNKFIVNSSTGDTSIYGGLVIGNALKVNGTLTVVNESSLNKLTVNNSLTVNGDITCTGNIILDKSDGVFNTIKVNRELTTVDLYADTTGNKNLAKFIVLGTNTFSPVSIKYTTESSSTSTGALVVSGGVGIGGNLNVNGHIQSLNGTSSFVDLKTNGSIYCMGELSVALNSLFNANMKVGGTLEVSNSVECDSLNVKNAQISSNLTTNTLQTNSNIKCSGNLFVSGETTLNGPAIVAGGLLLNSRYIPDEGGVYKILTDFSGSIFTLLGATKLRDISLPTPTSPGLNYKIVIGPNYTQPTISGFYIILRAPTNNFISGIINNNSTISKIKPNTYYKIKMQYPEPGDTIEISSINLNQVDNPTSANLAYHIKIIASTNNAYIPTNDSPLPP